MKKLLHFCLGVIVLLSACNPYESPVLDPGNDPIFSASGSVDGKAFNAAADGTFKAESSYSIDSFDLAVYSGKLTKCSSCEPKFALNWRADDKADPQLERTVMETNPVIRWISGMKSTTFYDITLNAKPSGEVASLTWTILDEQYTTPEVTLSVEKSEELTKFAVELNITYVGGCAASIVDTVYLPNHGCDCNIKIRQLDSLLYEYKGFGGGGSSYAFEWNFESSDAVSSREVTRQFVELPADGVEEIELVASTADCRASRKYNQYFSALNVGCAANFDYSIVERSELVPAGAQIDLGQVELVYTDENDNTFYSLLVEQDENAFFQVNSTEQYVDPFVQTDQRSMKIDASFNCLMSDGTTTIRITDGRLVLPIGLGAN